MNHEPILARPGSRARKSVAWLQKHPWAITGAGSFLVIGLVVLAYGLWQQGRFNTWLAAHPDEIVWIGFRSLLITLPFMFVLCYAANLLASRWFSRLYRRHKQTGAAIPRAVLWVCFGIGASEVLYALAVLLETVGLEPRLSEALAAAGQGKVWVPALGFYALFFCWTGSILVWKAIGTHELAAFGERVARSVELEEAPETRRRRIRTTAIIVDLFAVYVSVASAAVLFAALVLPGTFRSGAVAAALFVAAWIPPALVLCRRPGTGNWWSETKWRLLAAGLIYLGIWLLGPLLSSDARDCLRLGGALGLLAGLALQAAWRMHLRIKEQERQEPKPVRGFWRGWNPTVQGPVKTSFAVFLGLLLAVIGFWTVRAWQHASASYRHVEQLLSTGRMLARTNYLATPVPEDVNFGATPLLKSIAYKGKLNTGVWTRLVPFERVANDEGKFQLTALGEPIDLGLIARRLPGQIGALAGSRARAAESVLAGLAPAAAALDELRRASTRAYAQVEWVRPTPGARLEAIDLHGPAFRLLGQLLLLSASAELELGRFEEAQRELRVLQRLADAVSSNHLLVNTRLRADLIELWTKGFWEGWVAGRWSATALQESESWLASVNLVGDLDLSLRGEEPYWVNRAFEGQCAMAQCMPFLPFGAWYSERLLYNQLLFTFCQQAFDAAPRRVFPHQCRQAAAAIQQRLANHQPGFPQHHFAVFLTLEGTVQHAAFVDTRVNQARIAGALSRYRKAKGAYPESLDRLVPEFLTSVPHNLIGGQPMRYRRISESKLLLYSVGWDERDGGGISASPTIDSSSAAAPGNWVWPSEIHSPKPK